ncbi:hypothetical protein V8D89_008648 [Ganoderma adspersum]
MPVRSKLNALCPPQSPLSSPAPGSSARRSLELFKFSAICTLSQTVLDVYCPVSPRIPAFSTTSPRRPSLLFVPLTAQLSSAVSFSSALQFPPPVLSFPAQGSISLPPPEVRNGALRFQSCDSRENPLVKQPQHPCNVSFHAGERRKALCARIAPRFEAAARRLSRLEHAATHLRQVHKLYGISAHYSNEPPAKQVRKERATARSGASTSRPSSGAEGTAGWMFGGRDSPSGDGGGQTSWWKDFSRREHAFSRRATSSAHEGGMRGGRASERPSVRVGQNTLNSCSGHIQSAGDLPHQVEKPRRRQRQDGRCETAHGAEPHCPGATIDNDKAAPGSTASNTHVPTRPRHAETGNIRLEAGRQVVIRRHGQDRLPAGKTRNISAAQGFAAGTSGAHTSSNTQDTNARRFAPPALGSKIDANRRFHCVLPRLTATLSVPSASRPGSPNHGPRDVNRAPMSSGRGRPSGGMPSPVGRAAFCAGSRAHPRIKCDAFRGALPGFEIRSKTSFPLCSYFGRPNDSQWPGTCFKTDVQAGRAHGLWTRVASPAKRLASGARSGSHSHEEMKASALDADGEAESRDSTIRFGRVLGGLHAECRILKISLDGVSWMASSRSFSTGLGVLDRPALVLTSRMVSRPSSTPSSTSTDARPQNGLSPASRDFPAVGIAQEGPRERDPSELHLDQRRETAHGKLCAGETIAAVSDIALGSRLDAIWMAGDTPMPEDIPLGHNVHEEFVAGECRPPPSSTRVGLNQGDNGGGGQQRPSAGGGETVACGSLPSTLAASCVVPESAGMTSPAVWGLAAEDRGMPRPITESTVHGAPGSASGVRGLSQGRGVRCLLKPRANTYLGVRTEVGWRVVRPEGEATKGAAVSPGDGSVICEEKPSARGRRQLNYGCRAACSKQLSKRPSGPAVSGFLESNHEALRISPLDLHTHAGDSPTNVPRGALKEREIAVGATACGRLAILAGSRATLEKAVKRKSLARDSPADAKMGLVIEPSCRTRGYRGRVYTRSFGFLYGEDGPCAGNVCMLTRDDVPSANGGVAGVNMDHGRAGWDIDTGSRAMARTNGMDRIYCWRWSGWKKYV